jgi:hypothetical protein
MAIPGTPVGLESCHSHADVMAMHSSFDTDQKRIDVKPLAAPTARSILSADPATLLGWALLGGFGMYALWIYAVERRTITLVFGAVLVALLTGFVQAHRHPGSTFSRVWVTVFSLLNVVGAAVAKVAHFLGVGG